MQVDFYILDKSDIRGKLLFSCRIVQKAFSQGLRILVLTGTEQQSQHMDQLLWTFAQNSFIPHGRSGPQSADWRDYPVQVGHVPVATELVDVLVNLQEAVSDAVFGYRRVVEMVSDDQQDRDRGRARFRTYRARGVEPITHKIAWAKH